MKTRVIQALRTVELELSFSLWDCQDTGRKGDSCHAQLEAQLDVSAPPDIRSEQECSSSGGRDSVDARDNSGDRAWALTLLASGGSATVTDGRKSGTSRRVTPIR